jgi:hypothetical protein
VIIHESGFSSDVFDVVKTILDQDFMQNIIVCSVLRLIMNGSYFYCSFFFTLLLFTFSIFHF